MSPAVYAGFLVFALVASITPGPNNLMVMASGTYFGVRRTLPHLAGVSIGFGGMTLAVGLGLAGVFRVAPWLYVVLRWAAAAYLIYLAWRMVTAKGVGVAVTDINPLTFWHAVVFQWVNPKAWVMALGAVTTYADTRALLLDVALIAASFMLISAPCCLAWTVFGAGIKRLLKRPWALHAFNWTMAALLVASLYPLFTEPLGPGSTGPKSASPARPAASSSAPG